jgi:GTP cyclohydrolase I
MSSTVDLDRLKATEGLEALDAPESAEELRSSFTDSSSCWARIPSDRDFKRLRSVLRSSLAWLTRGYEQDVRKLIGDALFEESHENMVMVRDIELYSLCEHHMLPSTERRTSLTSPTDASSVLSKLPANRRCFRAAPAGAGATDRPDCRGNLRDTPIREACGVVIEAYHLCMMMRGVQKQNSKTITSALRGVFRDDSKTRDDFLRLAHAG